MGQHKHGKDKHSDESRQCSMKSLWRSLLAGSERGSVQCGSAGAVAGQELRSTGNNSAEQSTGQGGRKM